MTTIPHETCCCGAALYLTSTLSYKFIKEERASFREAHAICRNVYDPNVSLVWTRIDPKGPGIHVPKRDGDVGWDLEAGEDVLLVPHKQVDVPTNVRVKLPTNCWGEIRARSSIARMGLQVDAGVLDNGYTGPVFVLLRNMNSNQHDNKACDWVGRVPITKGQRIAQLVLHRAVWTGGLEVDSLDHDPRRGDAGFGSTGA